MKIFINKPEENWICDRIHSEFYKYNPDSSSRCLENSDLAWIAAPWMFSNYEALKTKKSIFSIYHITPSKFNKSRLLSIDSHASAIHTICEKTRDFIKDYVKKPIFVEPFWINQNIWFPLDKSTCRKELNLPEDAFIIGSFQRDTEGGDLKSPKLEKGPDQFCDIVEEMHKTKPVHILLGGWRRQYIIKRMNASNIPYTFMDRPPFDTLNKMYNSLDLYIVSSRFEGGPQSIPECAATKTPIISTNVGCAETYLSSESIFDFPNYKESSPNCYHAFEKAKEKFIPDGFDSYQKMFEKVLSL